MRLGVQCSNSGKHDRRTIGKLRYERQLAAQGFDRSAQRRDVHVGALLNLGDCFCAMPSFFAIFTCVIARARRISCRVISSAINSAARFLMARCSARGRDLIKSFALMVMIYCRAYSEKCYRLSREHRRWMCLKVGVSLKTPVCLRRLCRNGKGIDAVRKTCRE
jgi:hypothetical protein